MLVLQKGLFFPHDYTVPMSAITRSDADGVYLNVTKDDVTNQTFDTPSNAQSYQQTERMGAGNLDRSNLTEQPLTQTQSQGAEYGNAGNTDLYAGGSHPTPTQGNDIAVPVREEELVVGKERLQTGNVQVHKDVISEQQSVNVPVTQERVQVERIPVSGDAATNLGADAFSERDIDVPLMGEQVVAEKQGRVTEEVHLHKQAVTENQRVSDTVRKEQVRIDGVDEGNLGTQGNLRTDAAYDQTQENDQTRRNI